MKPKQKAMQSQRNQAAKVNQPWDKHPPMSIEHSAHYLHYKATIDANTNKLPINIRIEHIKQMIKEAGIDPCFAVLRMKYPQNGWLLGNVFCKSLV
jgi:hypothetical protein